MAARAWWLFSVLSAPTPLCLLISVLSLPLEAFTACHSPLQSSFLSWPWLLSPLHRSCAFTFSLAFSALPSPCCFPLLASALIGRLFLCANPTQARTAAVMPELSLTRRGLGCSSVPPTFPLISTFDRLGLWAAAAVDYRSISHLAHSVSATLTYKKHLEKSFLMIRRDDPFQQIFTKLHNKTVSLQGFMLIDHLLQSNIITASVGE